MAGSLDTQVRDILVTETPKLKVFSPDTVEEGFSDLNLDAFKTRLDFLRDINNENLKPLSGLDWWIGRTATLMNYVWAVPLTVLVLKYSPEKRGYVFRY